MLRIIKSNMTFKPFITAFLILATASSAFAWNPNAASQQSMAYQTSKSKIGLWFTAKENIDIAYTLTPAANSTVTSFGYSILNNDFSVAKNIEFELGEGIMEDIEAGSMIGFWYEENGIVYSSILANNEKNSGWHFGGRENTKDGKVYAFEDGDKNRVGSIIFKEPTPSGQPLPGLLLTLALSTASFVGFKFSKAIRR